MTYLFSIPGGSEWMIIFFGIIFFVATPITAIVLFVKNNELKRRIRMLTAERVELLKKA